MSAVLHNSFFLVLARVLHQIPTFDDLLRAMNREDALRDGSRYF